MQRMTRRTDGERVESDKVETGGELQQEPPEGSAWNSREMVDVRAEELGSWR